MYVEPIKYYFLFKKNAILRIKNLMTFFYILQKKFIALAEDLKSINVYIKIFQITVILSILLLVANLTLISNI